MRRCLPLRQIVDSGSLTGSKHHAQTEDERTEVGVRLKEAYHNETSLLLQMG